MSILIFKKLDFIDHFLLLEMTMEFGLVTNR